MTIIIIENILTLSYPELDEDHQHFADMLNQLENCDAPSFVSLFAQLLEHVETHFEKENQLMDKFNFPAIAEHKGEHQRVIGEIKQFKKRVDKGQLSMAKALIKERLPQWFSLHLATMDSALVAHIKRVQATSPAN